MSPSVHSELLSLPFSSKFERHVLATCAFLFDCLRLLCDQAILADQSMQNSGDSLLPPYNVQLAAPQRTAH